MPPQCPRCQNTLVVGDAAGEAACPSCGCQTELGATVGYLPEGAPRRLGKFELLEQLGAGAFGTVYKARDTELGRLVAIKVPRAGSLPGGADMDRFLREAKSAAALTHAGIVALYDAGTIDGTCCLVSEYVAGATLAERLAARRLDFREAAELVAAVAEALHYAHQKGVIHRDIKPSNVMLDLEGRPHLMDFGLAKRAADEAALTLEGQVMGTPAYMSPEQARGEVGQVDARSDVYSLGVVLYELLTGERPFRGAVRMLLVQVMQDEPRPPRRLNDAVPRDVETVCLKAMAKSPGQRYQSAGEMADDLRRWLKGEPIQARPAGRVEKAWRWCRRRPVVAGLSAAVLGLLLFVAVAAPLVTLREAYLRGEAEDREKDAVAARAGEAQLRREAEQQSLRLTLDKAWSLPEQGRVAEGMLWLVRGLERAPADDAALHQAIRANLAAWHEHLHSVQFMLQQGSAVRAIAFSPDGTLATGGADGYVRLWNLTTGEPIGKAPLSHKGPIQALAFRADGKRLYTATTVPAVHTWNTTTLEPVGEPLRDPLWVAEDKALGFGPGGGLVVVRCKDKTTRVWEIATRMAVGAPLPHAGHRCAPTFRLDGAKVVTCERTTAKVWDTGKAPPVGLPFRTPAMIGSAALSPDGTRLLLAHTGPTAQIWDAIRGEALNPPLRHFDDIYSACFSQDGRRALTCGSDRTARLWDAHTRKPIGPAVAHASTVRVSVFSPDGRGIVTGSDDGLIRVCRLGKQQPAGDPLAERAGLFAVSLAPHGRRALTADLDGTIRE